MSNLTHGLTPARSRVLDAFRLLTKQGAGIPPSLPLLAKHLGHPGTYPVFVTLQRLGREGFLVRRPIGRGWMLPPKKGRKS
jgi:hypothetical protein